MDNPESLFFDIGQYKYSEEYALECVQSGYTGRIGTYTDQCQNIIEGIYKTNCLLVANGTIALQLALKAVGIKRGDYILVPNISFVATINAIVSIGAQPIFIKNIVDDIFPDISNIEDCLIKGNGKIKSVILVHLYGTSTPNTKEIKELCTKYCTYLIEDNAQSFGAKHDNNVLVGSYGDISTISFFSNKIIPAGQGGAVIINNKKLFSKASLIANHGLRNNEFITFGLNYSFNNLSASVLLGNLENMKSIIEFREKIYQLYILNIKKLKINVTIYNLDSKSVKWVFPLRINSDVDKAYVIKSLNSLGVACRTGMSFLPNLPHINEKMKYNGKRPDDLLLPIHTSMNEESVIRVLSTLKKVLS